MPERLFSAYQVADLLGVTPNEVAQWIQKGSLPFHCMPNGLLRIREKGLIDFLHAQGIDIKAILAKAIAAENQKAAAETHDVAAASSEECEKIQAPAMASAGVEGRENHSSFDPPEPQPLLPPAGDLPHESQPQPIRPSGVEEESVSEKEPQPQSQPQGDAAAQVVGAILADALAMRGSDIVVESLGQELALKVRVDGVWHDKAGFRRKLPSGLGPRVLDCLAAMAGLPNSPAGDAGRTGVIEREMLGRHVVFHVVGCPTAQGQRFSIRVCDSQEASPDFDHLGWTQQDASTLRRLLNRPEGLILVAGSPRGDLNATLRALAGQLDCRRRDVIFVERSASKPLAGVTQILANEPQGLSFEQALELARLQGGDVLLADDIRDGQSLMSAVQLALTGRLVLASASALDVEETLGFLDQTKMKPCDLAASLLAIVSQRFVRRLCPHCRKADGPLVRKIQDHQQDQEAISVYRAQGCAQCHHIGYLGQTGIFSTLFMDQRLANLVRTGIEPKAIVHAAESFGMKTLLQAGLEKIKSSETSFEELLRVGLAEDNS